MKGSICYHKQRKYYYVSWLHKGKRYKIYRYNGEKIYHPDIAKKLVCAMQWDVEHGFFRIEKYTKETPTDVMPYMKKWLGAEKANLSPATYKDYLNSITNHLVPWFKVHCTRCNCTKSGTTPSASSWGISSALAKGS